MIMMVQSDANQERAGPEPKTTHLGDDLAELNLVGS